ncbi:glutamate--tRNA ligase [Gammaproteobacteria bacterium 45_16_T64]|nr:glutamate--tRNA ligase [Gammaproteobacteria bacterium 45_16_T64]
MTVRTRIAPSPTGDPHVGTAYIALFNMAFARKHGGTFVLRIEDTDQVRSTPESEVAILDSMKWLGLNWEEGPDIGGEHGPYRQSERRDIYAKYIQQLLDDGHAFKCFATSEELDEMRIQQKANGETPRYDGRGLLLSDVEIQQKVDAGEPYVVRMKVPEEGVCSFDDMLRGTIEIEWSQIDMQVLMKADGMPTYHLANVVDDHLMAISHVIRGEEWINSAPKHQLLYKYFGWEMPVLCHMPLLRNPDKSKLSKRKNPTSISYYDRMGFLPEAVVNYLARMGWSMPDEREKFTLDEMIAEFDISRVSLGGPVFDVEKLTWLNGLWIREELSIDALAERFTTWAVNKEYLGQVLPLIQKRINVLSDAAPLVSFFLEGMPTLTEESFEYKKLEIEQTRKILQFALWRLEAQREWNLENIQKDLFSLSESLEIKMRDFMIPIFVAVSGKQSAPSIMDAMEILGPDMTRARLRAGLATLGAPSKKELKRLEKEFKLFQ